MPPRDYKNNRAPKRSSVHAKIGSWFSFFTGLSTGLLVAFGVYLWASEIPSPTELIRGIGDSLGKEGSAEQTDVTEKSETRLPLPEFTFYNILPKLEVPVSDSDLRNRSALEGAGRFPVGQSVDARSEYVLQVGSFKKFTDADRRKAHLALRGIRGDIDRVVINGQDVWFRVNIGPLETIEEVRKMRVVLAENDIDSLLLRMEND